MNYKVILNFKYFNYCKLYFYVQRVKDPRNEGHYSLRHLPFCVRFVYMILSLPYNHLNPGIRLEIK